MNRRRLVVAGTDPVAEGAEGDATLSVSRERLRRGDEVVHVGDGLGAEAIARTAVAEDAVQVLLVGPPDGDGVTAVREALDALGAHDVTVSGPD